MADYEKFHELILEKATTYIKGLDQAELQKSLLDALKGVGKKPKRPRLTKEETFYLEIFLHLWEINKSLETLDYIPVFMNSFRKSKAYQEAGITRNIFLRYHIEHYLQENYILLARVKRFLGKLSHTLKNEGRIRESLLVSELRDTFENSMANLKLVRKDHVHEIRYDDDQLSRSDMFELASTVSEDEDLELAALLSSELVKEDWSKRIRDNNRDLKRVLDWLFEQLTPIVFHLDQGMTK